MRAPSSCGGRGQLLATVRGGSGGGGGGPHPTPAEHGLQAQGPQQLQHAGPAAVANGLQSAGSVALTQGPSLRGSRDPPLPGPEPASPAPAGGLPTTAPPGKPHWTHYDINLGQNSIFR